MTILLSAIITIVNSASADDDLPGTAAAGRAGLAGMEDMFMAAKIGGVTGFDQIPEGIANRLADIETVQFPTRMGTS